MRGWRGVVVGCAWPLEVKFNVLEGREQDKVDRGRKDAATFAAKVS